MSSTIDRKALRKLIDQVLPRTVDLDAFCIDHFPDVYRQFAANHERIQKINLLFQLIDSDIIHKCLFEITTNIKPTHFSWNKVNLWRYFNPFYVMLSLGLTLMLACAIIITFKGGCSIRVDIRFTDLEKLRNYGLQPIPAVDFEKIGREYGTGNIAIELAEPQEPQKLIFAVLFDKKTHRPLAATALRPDQILAAIQDPAASVLKIVAQEVKEHFPSFPNSPPDMILLYGRRFAMGSTQEDIAGLIADCKHYSANCDLTHFQSEGPQRSVFVNSFYLDRTEITNKQYADWLNSRMNSLVIEHDGKILNNQHRMLVDTSNNQSAIEYRDGQIVVARGFGNRPVEYVTWFGAREYCEAEGRRLPTEAEWEFAAHGLGAPPALRAKTSTYPWGNETPSCEEIVLARNINGVCRKLSVGPIDVGTASKDKTPIGVYDLGGNVSEWVQDAYQVNYSDCGPCIDPVIRQAASPSGELRVMRGGSWSLTLSDSRAASRGRKLANQAYPGVGFRCARSINE